MTKTKTKKRTKKEIKREAKRITENVTTMAEQADELGAVAIFLAQMEVLNTILNEMENRNWEDKGAFLAFPRFIELALKTFFEVTLYGVHELIKTKELKIELEDAKTRN
jgi:hypothetical protein